MEKDMKISHFDNILRAPSILSKFNERIKIVNTLTSNELPHRMYLSNELH